MEKINLPESSYYRLSRTLPFVSNDMAYSLTLGSVSCKMTHDFCGDESFKVCRISICCSTDSSIFFTLGSNGLEAFFFDYYGQLLDYKSYNFDIDETLVFLFVNSFLRKHLNFIPDSRRKLFTSFVVSEL